MHLSYRFIGISSNIILRLYSYLYIKYFEISGIYFQTDVLRVLELKILSIAVTLKKKKAAHIKRPKSTQSFTARM